MAEAPAALFSLLLELERRGLCVQRELPSREEVKIPWNGIGFRVGSTRVVAALNEVREIFPLPDLARVPGSVEWVKGVANVRGTLVPVLDLRGYLQLPAPVDRRCRVLVLNHPGLPAGLLVDEVMGLRHFTEDERENERPAVPEALRPFVASAFRQGDELWPVFDLLAVADEPAFMQVSAR